LSAWVDEALASRLTGLHKQLANVLFALLALHVLAIVVYVRVKKRQLIKPMLTGWKEGAADEGEPARKGGGPVAFVVALAIAVAAVVAVSEVVHPPGQGMPAVRSHAFIVEAIAQTVEQSELDDEFHRIADERWTKLVETRKTVPWEDAKAYLAARSRGEPARKPTARKLRG
jgi:hypothetical protein